MRLVDTHCHLNDPEAFPDPASAIEQAATVGVDRLIAIGVDADSSERAIELADSYPGVFAAVGWHPNYTASYSHEGLRRIEELLRHPKAVALGEIGLDNHWNYATPEQQELALLDQLELAAEAGKPIVLHCREAYPRLLEILEERRPRRIVFHCFSGSGGEARRAVALDAYFGVDGPITYKKAADLRSLLPELPRDRLLIETDSPYLSPEPHRGKPNRPAWVRLVNEALAAVLGIEPEACARLTTANAQRLFGLQ